MSRDTVRTATRSNVLRFRCFGEFAFLGEAGWERGPARMRGREFLQFLVAYPTTTVARDTVAEALWPHLNLDETTHRLHLAASGARCALRKAAVGVDPIRCIGGSYGWSGTIRIDSDAQRFNAHYNDGSIAAMREAIELYAGELFAGEVAEWIVPLRVRYATAYVTMLERLAEYAVAQHDYADAINLGLRLCAEEPGHEGAARLVMRNSAKLGRRGSAIAEYEALRRYLKRTLNVEPTEETEQLRRSILNGWPPL